MPKNNQQVAKSRRDTFRENFATRHPDVNMEDEEAYYGALDDEYNSREEELARNRESNEKLNNMFLENPNAAYFMADLLDGKKPMGVALMEQFGPLFKEAVNDPSPENVKAFGDALQAHADKMKKEEEMQAQYEANYDASQQVIEDWSKANNVTPEQRKAVQDYITNEFANLLSGLITPEMLDFALKGINHDADVAAAEEQGTARGRNQRIDEQLRKGRGDGMPMIAGGGGARERQGSDFLAQAQQIDPWSKAKREKY